MRDIDDHTVRAHVPRDIIAMDLDARAHPPRPSFRMLDSVFAHERPARRVVPEILPWVLIPRGRKQDPTPSRVLTDQITGIESEHALRGGGDLDEAFLGHVD